MAAPRDRCNRTALDRANFLAGHVVAAAEAFLDGRHNAARLAEDAQRLQAKLVGFDDPATNPILQPSRLITVAMMGMAKASVAAATDGAAVWRLERWEQVTRALVDLVRFESRQLREDRA
ncbi:hypothetical protein [Bradyrhizobium sp. SZCCHNR2032]|uniref:hypothetical protein n=1 Tax=Bradyrhizobium sp. SZCCHNR2032 TaxID=3057384 RepID=UPI002916746F|nr:hypothetical protein [Bradyrhizobium sp. SZCCHNR2032]